MEHLCKCNNCDAMLYDENPQVDAVKQEIPAGAQLMIPQHMIQIDSGDGIFWACPNCKTDEYLADL